MLGPTESQLASPQSVDYRAHVLRTNLADRMIEVGVLLRRPAAEMWGRLWRIDAHWERGELAAIASALGRLEWCVEHVGGPVSRWHLLVARAALAQGLGRFSEALELGKEAFESVRAIGHPVAFGGLHVVPDRGRSSHRP